MNNAASSIQQSNTAEQGLEKKEPCVATMVSRLYNPASTESASNFLAPNIFTRPEILNNCNGRNHINSLLEALKRHNQNNF